MRNLLWIGMVIVAAVSTIQATAVSPLPANIDVPRFLLEAVYEVYAQSDTFRAQCDRLGQAQNLRVTLHVDLQIPAVCRAFTIIQRKRGALCADVHLPAAAQVGQG